MNDFRSMNCSHPSLSQHCQTSLLGYRHLFPVAVVMAFALSASFAQAASDNAGPAGAATLLESPVEPRMMVSGISFSGNHVFSEAQLTAQIADDIGQKKTFSEVTQMAQAIERYYHQAGYRLASVVIPQQTFADDSPISFLVLEGRLGQVEVRGNQRYASQRIIDTLNAAGLQQASALRFEPVERGLTLINRRSGVEVSSTLKPGIEQGTTDLIVDVNESDRMTGSVEANNYGSETSGDYRLNFSLSLPKETLIYSLNPPTRI